MTIFAADPTTQPGARLTLNSMSASGCNAGVQELQEFRKELQKWALAPIPLSVLSPLCASVDLCAMLSLLAWFFPRIEA